ncbi:MAG: amidophosphoribosyltransferase [Candidatus Hecatellaceae archaeon]
MGSGIVGIYGFSNLWRMARFVYYALLALQHRGQETCGIVTYNGDGELYDYKASGLVDQVFSQPESLDRLKGWVGIGCVTTIPEKDPARIQPALVEGPVKTALCFDGKILNVKRLLEKVKPLEPRSEAELLALLLAQKLDSGLHPIEAASQLMGEVRGVYSLIALTERGEMVAARDPLGVKPLAIGSFGFDYGVIASESCAIDVIGADFKSDVQPGEIYYFDAYSIERKQAVKPQPKYCAFEHVYLARPDSIVNELPVYDARIRIGELLAEEHPAKGADIVLGVPETAIPFAIAYAQKARLPFGLGFVQTGRRIRSAIKPTQFERLVGVQLKLNPIKAAIAGRKIVLVDDSVVRGTTTKNTVNLMRNKMGAKEVHVRVGSPRIVAQCPYGTEVPPRDELIAACLTTAEVSRVVGADSFHWLSVKGLVKALGIPRSKLCLGCFTGKYPLLEEE